MFLQHTANNLLEQLANTASGLKPEDFSRSLSILNHASIGQHIRHTIEFFLCLMDARNGTCINYDNRKHDHFIETDPELAVGVISSIQEMLQTELEDFSIELTANYSLEGDESVRMTSSFFRELSYNIEHAIHHMALIKVGIQHSFGYLTLPEDFGVASSTIRFQQNKS